MRYISLILAFLLNIEVFSQEGGIIFQKNTSLDSILSQANKENKLVFLDCYATWCGPCRTIERDVFTKKEVGDFFNMHFINVKYDAEKGEGLKIKQRYNIHGFPTILYLNAQGEIVHIYNYNKNIDNCIALLENAKSALSPDKNYKVIKLKIDNRNYSIETILAFLDLNPYPPNIDTLLSFYFRTIEDSTKISNRSWQLFKEWNVDINNSQFKFLLKNINKFEQKFGKKAIDNKIISIYHKTILDGQYITDTTNLFYKKAKLKFDYCSASDSFKINSNSIEKWKVFIQKTKDYLKDQLDTVNLCSISWLIYENYKEFNDINSLKLAKEWSFVSVCSDPNSSVSNDTYAHILFDLGYITDAIKYEEVAFNIAINDKNDFSEFCRKELVRFKRKIKK